MDETIRQNLCLVLNQLLDIETRLRAISRKAQQTQSFALPELSEVVDTISDLEQFLSKYSDQWYLLYVEETDGPELLEETKDLAFSDFDLVMELVTNAKTVLGNLIGQDYDQLTALCLLPIAMDFGFASDTLDIWQMS